MPICRKFLDNAAPAKDIETLYIAAVSASTARLQDSNLAHCKKSGCHRKQAVGTATLLQYRVFPLAEKDNHREIHRLRKDRWEELVLAISGQIRKQNLLRVSRRDNRWQKCTTAG
jgi:FtsZ-binding cell division protein ZapB